jgi:hypothetical protein
MKRFSSDPDVQLDQVESPRRFRSPFDGNPFAMLIVSDGSLSKTQRNRLCDEIVRSGCRYACCAGPDGEIWHDTLDESFIATDPEFDPPEDALIMTTWHDAGVEDGLSFLFHNTRIDGQPPSRYLILCVGAGVDPTPILAELQSRFSR